MLGRLAWKTARMAAWMSLGAAGLAAAPAGAADGLALPDARAAWPQWQARISLATTLPRQHFGLSDRLEVTAGSSLHGGTLLGDYYFPWWRLGWLAPQGGLRATSGLMVGTRMLALPEPAALGHAPGSISLAVRKGARAAAAEAGNGTVPYLGIGYTGLSLKGGWGFTADLGLTAEGQAGNLRLGRAPLGNQGADSALRELRLSPLLQLGVSYSF